MLTSKGTYQYFTLLFWTAQLIGERTPNIIAWSVVYVGPTAQSILLHLLCTTELVTTIVERSRVSMHRKASLERINIAKGSVFCATDKTALRCSECKMWHALKESRQLFGN